MSMNRRNAVKGLLLVTGGLLFLPACVKEAAKASVNYKHLTVTRAQEQLLAELSETVLPATDTAGAKALKLHLFALRMVDDVYAKEDQNTFQAGLDAFEAFTQKQAGTSFTNATPQQRQNIVVAVNAGNAPGKVVAFYNILKAELIKGYLHSELVMTKFRKYELVPSRYIAVHPVSAANKK